MLHNRELNSCLIVCSALRDMTDALMLYKIAVQLPRQMAPSFIHDRIYVDIIISNTCSSLSEGGSVCICPLSFSPDRQ